MVVPTYRRIEDSDREKLGNTYKEVFRDAPWFEEWKLEDAIGEIDKAKIREGFVGVLYEDGRIAGFSWGYKLPRENFDGKNFLEIRELLKKLGLDPEKTFYGAETGVIGRVRGKGIGTGLLEYRTSFLMDNTENIVFRTKNEVMVSVYKKVFGENSVSELASDPVYPDRKLYLVRVDSRRFPTSIQYKNYLKSNNEDKSVKIQRAKGTRDFLPEYKILRDNIINTIKEVFELYGYNPLETPVLERFDILSSKYTGGAEILKETFKLKDQGGRDLALRYDLTVPFARVIGMNPNLKMPFKRYQIADVFRDGPIKAGRYRVFMQCDVDIVGCKDVRADAEMLNIARDIFNRLKLDIVIKANNRKILDVIMDYAGIENDKREGAILSIDKLEKLGVKYVEDELKNVGLKDKQVKDLINILTIKGNNNDKIEKLKKLLKNQEGLKEVEELLRYADAEFDVSLARGLSYYTGNIFEVYLKNSEIKSSVAAGGRYDKMIGSLIGRGEYPAVGISFGLDVITDTIKLDKKLEFKKSVAKVYVIPIKTFDESIKIIQKLRSNNVKTDIDLMDRGISKNLDYADKLGIPFVLIIGEDEIRKNKYKLKDMKSGKEEMLSIEELIKRLHD